MSKEPLRRRERDQCYKARDLYFKCLDENDLVLDGLKVTGHEEILSLDPLNISQGSPKDVHARGKERIFACREFKKAFEKSCPSLWVEHFSILRVKDTQTNYVKGYMDLKKKEIEKGGFWDKAQQGFSK